MSKSTSKSKKAPARTSSGEGPVKVLLAEDEESFIEALMIGLTKRASGSPSRRRGRGAAPLRRDRSRHLAARLDVAQDVGNRRVPDHPHPFARPIIMVTAKGTEIDTVVALEVGAETK